jgi:hypothetical protein
MFESIKRLFRAPTAEQLRADAAQAKAQLLVAKRIADTAQIAEHLAPGTRALSKARRLDAEAYITDKDGNEHTHDDIAAHLCYLESRMLLTRAWSAIKSPGYRADNHDVQKNLRDAVKAAERAAQYRPDHVVVLNQLAEAYWSNSRKGDAKRIVKKILKADPGNIDALTLENKL